MKIAMIGQKGIPANIGGIERHVEELSVRLVAKGHTVRVYSRFWYTKSTLTNYKGVEIAYLPSIHTKNLDAITHTFLSVISALRGDFDIIHFHGVGPALLAWIPRLLKPKTKVITTFHCIDRKHQKWGRVARLALKIGEWCALKFSHETITVSKTLTQYSAQRYHKKTRYIPNGYTITEYDADDSLLEPYNLQKNQYIISVARFVRHKGLHTLIQAYKNLATPYKLAIVGDTAFTSDYGNQIRTLASDTTNVVFLGMRSAEELSTLYDNAAFMVHPSEAEGLSVAVLEAMSHGKAVLAANIPEMQEVIADKAFLFENKNVQSLTQHIDDLLTHPEKVAQQAHDRKQFVEENFNWNQIVSQVEAVYQTA